MTENAVYYLFMTYCKILLGFMHVVITQLRSVGSCYPVFPLQLKLFIARAYSRAAHHVGVEHTLGVVLNYASFVLSAPLLS